MKRHVIPELKLIPYQKQDKEKLMEFILGELKKEGFDLAKPVNYTQGVNRLGLVCTQE